eukprot:gene4930-biopygen1626
MCFVQVQFRLDPRYIREISGRCERDGIASQRIKNPPDRPGRGIVRELRRVLRLYFDCLVFVVDGVRTLVERGDRIIEPHAEDPVIGGSWQLVDRKYFFPATFSDYSCGRPRLRDLTVMPPGWGRILPRHFANVNHLHGHHARGTSTTFLIVAVPIRWYSTSSVEECTESFGGEVSKANNQYTFAPGL